MKVGDKVEWLETKRTSKNGFRFTMRQGKLVATNEISSCVKSRAKIISMPTKNLHVVGDGPNQLTQLMRGPEK